MQNQFFVPPHMQNLANQTVGSFGYDTSDTVQYQFNSLGFRGPELKDTASVIVIGNSVSFGLGLEFQNTYGYRVADHLGLPVANFSFGCYYHSNADYLDNIKLLSQRSHSDVFLIQINNINRLRINHAVIADPVTAVPRVTDYLDEISNLLKNKQCVYLMWDNVTYSLPESVINMLLIHNKFHLDKSLPDHPDTFGILSNQAVAKIIAGSLTQSR
jgi:hypothetical protein